jgi:replicative DNA helicase
LEYLVNEAIAKPGLRWRLTTLNQSLGSLRKGNFGFIFARPETGKTTFLASEVSFMLTQTEGCVVWINNEEEGDTVMFRVYQAFFGVTSEELFANVPKFRQLFKEATQGRFKLYDSAQTDRTIVETICKRWKPALLVIDQIDKIKGFDADRPDLQLGAIYIWARELAKEYCPVIGICQADGSGENVRYLSMANVANAKTSKQAEADFILGIGAIHDQGWESVRFLNISKNKLRGDADTQSKLRHAKMEVLIQPDVARYKDM